MFGEGDRLVLLHNPRCSKSRAAHALLEEHGEAFDTRTALGEEQQVDERERQPHQAAADAGVGSRVVAAHRLDEGKRLVEGQVQTLAGDGVEVHRMPPLLRWLQVRPKRMADRPC